MTDSTAIQVLNMIETHGSLSCEAKDKAVKALEKQVVRELISTEEYLGECCCQNCKQPILWIEEEFLANMKYCPFCGQRYREV